MVHVLSVPDISVTSKWSYLPKEVRIAVSKHRCGRWYWRLRDSLWNTLVLGKPESRTKEDARIAAEIAKGEYIRQVNVGIAERKARRVA